MTKRCHAFIQTAMDSLCSTQNADLLAEGRGAFPEAQLTMVSRLHEVLLSEITVAGMDDPPAEVRALFESFLRQLSLPRLVHFFDLVLAQMIPRWETSAGQARSRLVCCAYGMMPGTEERRGRTSVSLSCDNLSPELESNTLLSTGSIMKFSYSRTPSMLSFSIPMSFDRPLPLSATERMCS